MSTQPSRRRRWPFPRASRLLEVARCQVVKAAKAAGIELKQTLAREGKQLTVASVSWLQDEFAQVP